VAYQDELPAVHLGQVEKSLAYIVRPLCNGKPTRTTVLLLFCTKAGEKIVETLEKKEY